MNNATNIQSLTCCVCGEDAGKWKQWHNRDTGYGICVSCVDWLQNEGVTAEEIKTNYGIENINYQKVN